jgi:sirohydrochlorin cobaltochelatase
MRGFVLLAHGARNPQWGALFETLAQDLGHAGQPARAAYLEYLQPDFGAAVDALVADGCRDIHVLPCFFAASGHVMRDLPGLLEVAGRRHPGLRWRVLDALGDQPAFRAALLGVCQQLLAQGRDEAPLR